MAHSSQASVTVELSPHMEALRRILIGGVEDYFDQYSDAVRTVHCPTTKAGIIHDHQVARASNYSVMSSGLAKLLDFSGLWILSIGRCAIRFKKFNEDLISRNQPTKQVEDFRRQQPLPGLPQTVNLECGYRLDAAGTSVAGTWLVQPSGRGVKWQHEIVESGVKPVVENLFEYMDKEEEADGESGAILVPKTVTIRKNRDGD